MFVYSYRWEMSYAHEKKYGKKNLVVADMKNVITFPNAATEGFVVTTGQYQAYAYGLHVPVYEHVYLEGVNDHLI